ncbi:MAG TPA: CRISPR-associated endonuclease Cas2 [Candidatus Paceibacterota bacterium]
MKLPITDQFLLSVYNFIEKADKTYDIFAPRSLREVVCPDLFTMRRGYGRERDRRKFSQLISYLKRKGYIAIKNFEQKKAVMLTRKGAAKVLRIKFKAGKKQLRKDGKWQMIIFDIPETKKVFREVLRNALYELGYQRLQDSVWVCPYEVEKETEWILSNYSLDPYVKIFVVEETDM